MTIILCFAMFSRMLWIFSLYWDVEFANNFLKGGKYTKIKEYLLFFILIKK